MSIQTSELISIAKNMPLADRDEIVDSLLEGMHPTSDLIDELWKAEIENRIAWYEAGDVQLIPGEEVFAKVRHRFMK